MAGLDTRGAFDGFVQGFGLMDTHFARQAAQKNATQQLEMQQRGLDMRSQEMAQSRDLAERRFGLDERQMNLQGERFAHQQAMDEKRYGLDERRLGIQDKQFERQMAADNRRFGLQERELGMREQERQQEQDTQVIRGAYAKIAEGVDLGDDELQAFKRMPWLSPAHVGDERMGQAVAQAARVFDPNDPADANDPQSLEAMNFMFGPRISRGEGGQKKIVGVYPGQTPGTVAFELEVTGEDGKAYRAPMTKNRSTADDDEVMQIPIEDVVNQVAGYKGLGSVLQHSGGRERAVALGQRLGLLDQVDTKGLPADVQTARWLVKTGAAAGEKEAWQMVRGARGKSRQDFALDYAKMLTSNQPDFAGVDGNTPRVEADQAFQTGLQIFDQLNGGSEVPAQQPKSAPGGPQVGHIEDGYEFLGGDPSSPNSWRQK